MAIKRGSAVNETFTEPVTHTRTTRKQGSPTIKEGTAIKKVIESGSTSATEIMAHNPWLASNAPSRETNKHVVPPERTHLTDPCQQWPPNSFLSKTWGVYTQGKSVVTLYNGPKLRHMELRVDTNQQRERHRKSLISLNDYLSNTADNVWLTEAGRPMQRQSGFFTYAVKVTNGPTSRKKWVH